MAKGEDITDQGELKVDEDKETFEWVAKDPAKMKGKKFYVEVSGKAKTDADYSEYEKGDKAVVPNVAKLTIDGEDLDSNEVKTEIPKDPEKEDPEKEEPEKEEPKKDEPKETPQKPEPKETPQNPEQPGTGESKPEPQAPASQGNAQKSIPNTGSETGFFDKVSQKLYNLFR